MDPTRLETEKPSAETATSSPTADADPWRLLDLIPVAWLFFVIAVYSVLAFAPTVPTAQELPGVQAADPVVIPFLAVVLLAGIIRYWVQSRRPGSLRSTAAGAPDESRPTRNRRSRRGC